MNKKIILTADQKQYMDRNWKQWTHEAMADHLKLNVNIVSNYCLEMGYRKKSRTRSVAKSPKRLLNPAPEPPKIKRWPANYSNISRDQHIDRILNMAI